jgi:hypothetical protein
VVKLGYVCIFFYISPLIKDRACKKITFLQLCFFKTAAFEKWLFIYLRESVATAKTRFFLTECLHFAPPSAGTLTCFRLFEKLTLVQYRPVFSVCRVLNPQM